MTKRAKNKKTETETLRQQAEARIAKRFQDAIASEKDPASLLHELQVHQIELEIQNEELRSSQALIEDSRKRFVELYEFAPVGYCTLDETGTIRHVNLTLVSLFEYSRKYVLGKPLSSFVQREDKDASFLFLGRLRRTNEQQRCELRLKKKNGGFFFAELISVPLADQETSAKQFLVSVSEIGARKQLDEQLRKQRELVELHNEFLNSILNGITDAFLAVDSTGTISYVNHNAEILSGRKREAVIGKRFDIAFPESKSVALTESQLRALQEGQPVVFEFFYPAEPFRNWYEIRLYPFQYGMCAFFTTITERKRIQENLEDHARRLAILNTELETFSYTVSHDLRNPLHSIASMVSMLRTRCAQDLDESANRYLESIDKNIRNMAQLIGDLLEFSKTSRNAISVGEFDFSAMVRDCIHKLREAQPERDVEAVIQDNLSMKAESKLMKIALDNLIGNSWKFTSRKQGARIEVGMQKRSDETVYFVRDNGAGFDAKYAEKLFQAFHRFHSQKEFPGTGIGLATVARIISRHNGRIWAESEKNNGAAFYFVLGT